MAARLASNIWGRQNPLVRAEKEVILAGGAINSPQVLMFNGIGPGGHLSEMGIDVVQDLPGVGETCRIIPPSGLNMPTRQMLSFTMTLKLASSAGNG